MSLRFVNTPPDLSFIVCVKDIDQTEVLAQRLARTRPETILRRYHPGGIVSFNTISGAGRVYEMDEPYSYDSCSTNGPLAFSSGNDLFLQINGLLYSVKHKLLRHIHSVRFSSDARRLLIASAGTDSVMEIGLFNGTTLEVAPHIIWTWSATENLEIPPEGLATHLRPYSINGAEYLTGTMSQLSRDSEVSESYEGRESNKIIVSSFKGAMFLLHIAANRVCDSEQFTSRVTPHSSTSNHFVESRLGVTNINGVDYTFNSYPVAITRDLKHGEWIQSVTMIKANTYIVVDSHRSCFWIIDLSNGTISAVSYDPKWAVQEVRPKYSGLLMSEISDAIDIELRECIIPFNVPLVTTEELKDIANCFTTGKFCGGGVYTKRCEALLMNLLRYDIPLGQARVAAGPGPAQVQLQTESLVTTLPSSVLMTSSCTDALEMCAVLLRISIGDEIIVPNYTYVSTVNAFVIHGATPVYCDVNPLTGNIDPVQLESLITPKTKAICIIHYGGVSCDMDAIMKIVTKKTLFLIEDAAHALGSVYHNPASEYHNRPLATFGDLATFSFHETKNIQCGEGGALVINNKSLVDRANIILEKGTDRTAFLNGRVASYGWCDVGSSYTPSEISCAMLSSQLVALKEVNIERVAVCDRYREQLKGEFIIPERNDGSNGHIFHIIFESVDKTDRCISYMKQRGIVLSKHYLPLSESSFGKQWKHGEMPVSEKLGGCLVRLPLFCGITGYEIDRIVAAFFDFSSL